MKELIVIIGVLLSLYGSAQNDALTTEIKVHNDIVYFEDQPLNGTLYEYHKNGNPSCSCISKSQYIDGKLNGKLEKWYVGGAKKYAGFYKNGFKENLHSQWDNQGRVKYETQYIHNRRIDEKGYYSSGSLKFHKKYNPKNPSELIYNKTLYDGNIIKSELHQKNGEFHGDYITNFDNGEPFKRIKYNNGVVLEKIIYDESGEVQESFMPLQNSELFESIYYEYNNGKKQQIKGYYTKERQKDSLWLVFDENKNRIREQIYNKGQLIHEGSFFNNKKEGIWKHYLDDGIHQKNTHYTSGISGETITFNKNHLFKNHFKYTDDVLLLAYKKLDGTTENITLTSDTPFTQERTEQLILGTAARAFLERTKQVPKDSIDDNTLITKKIHISDMRVKYSSSTYTDNLGSGENITGYDAFILFNLEMTDADNNRLFFKSYKMNKSDKLLNSLLNTAAQTFARTKESALNSALKSFKFKKLFKKYFPIEKK